MTVYECANRQALAPRVFNFGASGERAARSGPGRGRALRYVRTIFDRTNSPPEVELVLGEVVPSRRAGSSYPPHHHPQHEIYHYRFTEPQGYVHAELAKKS